MIFKDTVMIMGAAKKSERGSKLLKFFDRCIGIPLVFVLGFVSIFRRKKLPSHISKIAILKTAAIGDTVLLTAILQDLKIAYPKVEIHFYCGNSNYGFVKLLSQCNKVILLPLKNPIALWKATQLESYDLLLDFGAWPRINAVCSFFIKAHYKVGFKTQGQARHFVYDKKVQHSNQVHEIENYRNILGSVEIPVVSAPQLPQGSDVSSLINAIQRPYVVCHLWPGGERADLKEWPRENWKTLMLAMIKSRHCDIVLTGGKEDQEKNLDFISDFSNKNHIYDLSGIKIEETISVLKKAQLVISVNTGVMHLAAACGVRTIGLHGPTSIRRWGPIGNNCRSIASDIQECGYLNLGFEYKPELKCMEGISYEKVFGVVANIL